MNPQDRSAIESVFNRIQEVEQQGGQRDNDAEQLIHERLQKQPGSAYYLAQTVLIQEQALKKAQQRIQELEKPASTSIGAGALSSVGFGRQPTPDQRPVSTTPPASDFGRKNSGAAGGGFLAGALQTAMGVAGGVMLGNMLGGLFGGNDAQAAEPPAEQAPAHEEAGQEPDYASDEGSFDDF